MLVLVSVVSAIAAFELINILYQLNPTLLKLFLGYAVYLEIFFSVVLTGIAAGTGTITGIIVASVTGFFVTLVLIASKKIIGYKKFKRVEGSFFKFEIIDVPGTATCDSVGSAVRGLLGYTFNMIAGFTRGLISNKRVVNG